MGNVCLVMVDLDECPNVAVGKNISKLIKEIMELAQEHKDKIVKICLISKSKSAYYLRGIIDMMKNAFVEEFIKNGIDEKHAEVMAKDIFDYAIAMEDVPVMVFMQNTGKHSSVLGDLKEAVLKQYVGNTVEMLDFVPEHKRELALDYQQIIPIQQDREIHLIHMTDIDGTLNPIGPEGIKKYIDTFIELKRKNPNASIRICPISARQSDYVAAIMDVLQLSFLEIINSSPELSSLFANQSYSIIEYGAGDHGGGFVCYDEKCFRTKPIEVKNAVLERAQAVIELIRDYINRYNADEKNTKKLILEIGKKFTCHVTVDTENISEINQIVKLFLDNVIIPEVCKTQKLSFYWSAEGVDIVPDHIGKDFAVNFLVEVYSQRFPNKCIFAYSGDTENDRKAIRYMVQKGTSSDNFYVFLPGNAAYGLLEGLIKVEVQPGIYKYVPDVIEEKSEVPAQTRYEKVVSKGNSRYFMGVMEGMQKSDVFKRLILGNVFMPRVSSFGQQLEDTSRDLFL